MNYRDWEQTVPAEIRSDSVWKSEAYRLALFASDLAWMDATKLIRDKRTVGVADQLLRAVGAVSADIEEGYSRATGRDRARFYEYGLGSAREARGWYYKGRHILGELVVQHRLALITQVIKLLLAMVPDQRGYTLRESETPYVTSIDNQPTEQAGLLDQMLIKVPMPDI